jgi:rod shape determining protein RodA
MLFNNSLEHKEGRSIFIVRVLQWLHMDVYLLIGIMLLAVTGMMVLYSASGQDFDVFVRHATRFGLALGLMFLLAQLPASFFRFWSPVLYVSGVIFLVLVLVIGDIAMGAQRWLDLGFIRFQPSEMMKLATPMMVAWFFAEKVLPPSPKNLLIAGVLVLLPVLLIAKQPDLGTALLVLAAGFFVIFLGGVSWRLLLGVIATAAALLPIIWKYFMHDYQRQRVHTLLDPESDPLGSGYHIIQSKIAIGSGGLFGRGWLNGTQTHLDFLPEQSTDFIFAVFGEEFGLIGGVLLLTLYVFVVLRCLMIAAEAQDTYSRLLGGSLALTFFVYFFVNVGMVSGILPVVGVPLPLISYGGTSMVTLMAAFGMLMSINSHRRLWSK